jgi:hypothetical protein
VIELLNQGKKNSQILEIIKNNGFTGSEKTLRNFTKEYRDGNDKCCISKENGYTIQRMPRKKIMALLFKYPE